MILTSNTEEKFENRFRGSETDKKRTKKGDKTKFYRLLPTLCGPTRARTWDPLIMSQML